MAIHGSGEGLFMKGLNCGCALLIGFVVFIVILVAIATMNS